MVSKSVSKVVTIAVTTALLAAGPAAPVFSQDGTDIASTTSAETLKERILDALGGRVSTANPEDIEGTIMFVLNQADYDDTTIESALSSLIGTHGTANVVTAVSAVRAALAKNKRRGTAGIFDGGNGGAEFSSPASSGAGGGSNYTLS